MDSGHLTNLGRLADLEKELLPFWEGQKQVEAQHGARMVSAGVRKKTMGQQRKEGGPCPAGKHPTWMWLRWQIGKAVVL